MNVKLNGDYFDKDNELIDEGSITCGYAEEIEPVYLKLEFCMKKEDYEELSNLCKYYKVHGGIHELLQNWLDKENGDEFNILMKPYY